MSDDMGAARRRVESRLDVITTLRATIERLTRENADHVATVHLLQEQLRLQNDALAKAKQERDAETDEKWKWRNLGEEEHLLREKAEDRLAEAERALDECCSARDTAGFIGTVPDCIEALDGETKILTERAEALAAELAKARDALEKISALDDGAPYVLKDAIISKQAVRIARAVRSPAKTETSTLDCCDGPECQDNEGCRYSPAPDSEGK